MLVNSSLAAARLWLCPATARGRKVLQSTSENNNKHTSADLGVEAQRTQTQRSENEGMREHASANARDWTMP